MHNERCELFNKLFCILTRTHCRIFHNHLSQYTYIVCLTSNRLNLNKCKSCIMHAVMCVFVRVAYAPIYINVILSSAPGVSRLGLWVSGIWALGSGLWSRVSCDVQGSVFSVPLVMPSRDDNRWQSAVGSWPRLLCD